MAFAAVLPLLGELVGALGVGEAGAAVAGGEAAGAAGAASSGEGASGLSNFLSQGQSALNQVGSAIGKITGNSGSQSPGSGLENKVGSTLGMVTGGIGIGVGIYEAASKAMEAWTNQLIQSQSALGEWSGTIAMANTQMTYQHNLQDIERGQRTGSSYKFLTESKVANEQAWLQWEAAWTNFSNTIAGYWNYFEAFLGEAIKFIPGAQAALDAIAGKGKPEASPLGGFFHDIGAGILKKDSPWKIKDDN